MLSYERSGTNVVGKSHNQCPLRSFSLLVSKCNLQLFVFIRLRSICFRSLCSSMSLLQHLFCTLVSENNVEFNKIILLISVCVVANFVSMFCILVML